MPNLAEYWEFTSTSLTTNATVTNWIGAIQGIPLTNGAAAFRPTNSASGVGFDGTKFLTNSPINIGSNFIVTVFWQYTLNNLSGVGGAPFIGSNSMALANNVFFQVGAQFGGSGKLAIYWTDHTGTIQDNGGNVGIPNIVTDLSVCYSNNVNGGSGAVHTYTNGNVMKIEGGHEDSAGQSMSCVACNSDTGVSSWSFGGFIQGVYIETNVIITPSIASNIHYYRTNFLTKGASP